MHLCLTSYGMKPKVCRSLATLSQSSAVRCAIYSTRAMRCSGDTCRGTWGPVHTQMAAEHQLLKFEGIIAVDKRPDVSHKFAVQPAAKQEYN